MQLHSSTNHPPVRAWRTQEGDEVPVQVGNGNGRLNHTPRKDSDLATDTEMRVAVVGISLRVHKLVSPAHFFSLGNQHVLVLFLGSNWITMK